VREAPSGVVDVIAARGRGAAVATILVAATVVAGLGLHYAGTDGPGRIDRHADSSLMHLGFSPSAADRVSSLGGPLPVTVMALVLAAIMVAVRRPRTAVLALATPALAASITEWVLKPLIGRRLENVYAFPSGHTTGIFAIVFVVIIALCDPRVPRRLAASGSVLALIVGGCVAVALVAGHEHYATDTIGGACVALATVLVLALVIDASWPVKDVKQQA
jgi:undecaprenyl-diphosphatase